MAEKRVIQRKPEAYIGDRQLKPESANMTYGHTSRWSERSINMPIYLSNTFDFDSAEEAEKTFRGLSDGTIDALAYSRFNNPNLEKLEDCLALWDDAEACISFSSGMAAIDTVLTEFTSPGEFILHSEPLYGGTEKIIKTLFKKFGVNSIGFNPDDSQEEIEKKILISGARFDLAMIYIETPANPTLTHIDIEMCSRIAQRFSTREKKVITCADNTFFGPLWQNPLAHGADLVFRSDTKYTNGHSDCMGGSGSGSSDLIGRLRKARNLKGNMQQPFSAWLLCRSLDELKMRMTQQRKNAEKIANFLASHSAIEKVYYPGLLKPDTRQYDIYKQQCLGPGAMISFDMRGGKESAFRVLIGQNLKPIKIAVSLGGVESLITHPASTTHYGIPPAELARMGVSDSLIRLSVGAEDADDLIAALSKALEAA